MVIRYAPSIEDIFTSPRKLSRKYGQLSKFIVAVINGLKDADITNHMSLPGHPHPLTYYDKQIFSITVHHPFRLIYTISGKHEVCVLGCMDYHSHHKRYSQI